MSEDLGLLRGLRIDCGCWFSEISKQNVLCDSHKNDTTFLLSIISWILTRYKK